MLIGFVSYFFSTLIILKLVVLSLFARGTTTVLFIGLTDIEIRQFTPKKEEFGLKYSMAIHLAI